MTKTAIILAAFFGVNFFSRAQEKPTFKADVQLVTVDVQVRDGPSGPAIDLLGPKDFTILDEGQSREIKVFHYETTPLDIVFVQYSQGGLVSIEDYKELHRGLQSALQELRPIDRAGVLRTHEEGKADLPLTADRSEIERVLLRTRGRLRPGGYGDRLYDAIHAAIPLFTGPSDDSRRRTVLAITDDRDRHSHIRIDLLGQTVLEAGILVNEVILVTTKPRVQWSGGHIPIPGVPNIGVDRQGGVSPSGDSLLPVVKASGGEAIPGDRLGENLPGMLRRLRARYLLGFYVSRSGERQFHRLEVHLTEGAQKRYPQAAIRARRGYYTQ